MNPFSDADAVAHYAEGPVRMVPGFHGLQRMTTVLLAERVPHDARILVLGAGGGLELKVFADAHPEWTFDGVDPSGPMLRLAVRTLGPLASRARLHEGYIDVAPEGPFDGAACILTMHFMALEERRRVASEVRRRLKPGAPFVVAHYSIPEADRALWLARDAAFAVASGLSAEQAEARRVAVGTRLPILAPAEDEAVLRDAGFSGLSEFYVGFTFRGWVSYA